MFDLPKDGLDRGGPDEGRGVGVVHLDEGGDSIDEFRDTAEGAPLQSFAGERAEPALDEVQPGAGGGREVEVEARVSCQPLSDLRMGVGAVIVEHEVEIDGTR